MISRLSPRVTIHSMYPQGRVTIPLKSCKSNPSYSHNISLFSPIFLKRLAYMISQELPPSIKIPETSKLEIVVVITKGNFSLWIPLTFSLSRNSKICFFELLGEVLPYFLLTSTNLTIFLIIMLFERLLDLGAPLVMEAIY